MPAAVPIVTSAAALAAGTATTGALAASAFTILGATVTVGQVVGIGIGALGSVLQLALTPKPSAVTPSAASSAADSAGPRWVVHGECRTAGSWLLHDSGVVSGNLCRVIVVANHAVAEFVEHRLDNEPVTLDENGWVQTPEKWKDLVQIITRDGTQTEVIPQVQADMSYWTDTHVGGGMALVFVRQRVVGAADLARLYPGPGYLLPYSCVLRGFVDIYDPRTGETGWSENAALCLLGHLRRSLDEGGEEVPDELIDFDSWAAGADICDERVPLKEGGDEARYIVSGIAHLDQEPREYRRQMLDAMDAEIYWNADGKLALRHSWEEAGAGETIDDNHIISALWVASPNGVERYNRVVATHNSAAHDFQPQSTPHFEVGLAPQESRRTYRLDLPMCPSGTQAQRLAKRQLERLRSPYMATITTDMAGLVARPTGPVAFTRSSSDPDDDPPWTGSMRVTRQTIGQDLTTVELECVAVPAGYGAWDADVDEQDIPPLPALDATDGILTPPIVGEIEIIAVAISGRTTAAKIRVNFTALDDETVTTEMQTQINGATVWSEATTGGAVDGMLDSSLVEDGQTYSIRIRFVGAGGGVTGWTQVDGIEVIAEAIEPGIPTAFSAVEYSTQVSQITATAPSDAYHYALRFFHNDEDVFETASQAGSDIVIGAGATAQVNITETGFGTYYYWAASVNASGVQGDETASASVLLENNP